MTKGLAIIVGTAFAAGAGAVQASDLYGNAKVMEPAELRSATGRLAIAGPSDALALDINLTGQENSQAEGIFSVGACSQCDAANANNTSQSTTGSSSATANNPNTAIDNINIGVGSGQQF